MMIIPMRYVPHVITNAQLVLLLDKWPVLIVTLVSSEKYRARSVSVKMVFKFLNNFSKNF
jgi:hypothetical protein